MKRFLCAISVSVWILLACPRLAWGYDLASKVKQFTLQNGMRWLVVRRTQAPVFSGVIMVRVGGADEVVGKTGLAHMFEHMAFKGSSRLGTRDYGKELVLLEEIERVGEALTQERKKRRPDRSLIKKLSLRMEELTKEADRYQVKGEIWEVMARNGAKGLNAFTNKDITAYFASMPTNRLELWARVFAELIFDPVFREFYTERKVVAEERRASVENDPDGALAEKILSASFKNGPYHWSTIGFEEDIRGLTIGDAREFYRRHYVPANMVGVLVGDVSLRRAKRIIRQVFGGYPPGAVPPGPYTSNQPRGGVRERFWFIAEPELAVAYHKPTLPDPTEYVFDVITYLLCEGRTSRLQKSLVYEKRMAKDIYCSDGYPGSRLENLLLIWVEPLKPYAPRRVLKEVMAEIDRLRREPVDEKELTKVRRHVTASMVMALDNNMSLAQALARFEAIFGDWRLLATYPDNIAKVDAKEVMAVANKYLTPANRVVVERMRPSR
jgi:predicted Zn-dependent peptidase